MRRTDHQSGFTLLEVLIAVTITSMISLGIWQLLNGTIRGQSTLQSASDRLSELQRTMLFISRDITQIIPRSIRNEYGDQEEALTTQDNFYSVKLTRTGWRNPLLDPRSDLQRVGYLVEDGSLVRKYWRVLDRAQDSDPISQTLMGKVESIKISLMNDKGSWVENWPTDDMLNNAKGWDRYNRLPKALKITIETLDFGTLERLYDVPEFIVSGSNATGTNSSGSNSGNN